MKRILNNIMLLGMSALLFASCSEELAEELKQGSACLDGTVLVKIGIGGDPATKAMAETPDIKNLMVAVFDDAGYLAEYKEATVSKFPTQNGEKQAYEVELSVNPDARSIHFIANGPETVKLGSEEDVIGTMVAYANPTESQLGPDMYWQKILLPNGIKYKFGGNGLPEKVDGKDGVYVLDEGIAQNLANVGLVRNFAKFTISSAAKDFTLVNAVILNTPDRGYAAPYNRSTAGFITNYNACGVSDLMENGYTASVPASMLLEKKFENTIEAKNGIVTSYMFEREKPTHSKSDEPTFIVVGGYYKENTNLTYYKINLQDYKTDDFFPIFRNFDYKISLEKVVNEGEPSQKAAANSAGTGDISVISNYSSLPSISNGLSKLEVETVERVIVSDLSDTEIPLHYKFVPDLAKTDSEGNAIIKNDYKLIVNGVPDSSSQITDFDQNTEGVEIIVGAPGASGTAITGIRVDAKDENKQRAIYITPAAPGETQKVQTITIIGHHFINSEDDTDKYLDITIRREIKIIVRPPYEMTADLEPAEVMKTVGEPVALNINLPEGLLSSIFPLHMNIEAENLTLSPNEGRLTVEYGNSIIEGSTRRSAYHFVKTINWSDYYVGENTYNTVFPVNLKTNAANSATDVYVTNEYFNPTHTTLKNRANAVYATIPEKDWYTTYSAANNHVAEGQKTTLTAKAKFVPTSGNKVEFKITIDGKTETVTGVTDGTKDANGYYTYTADYTPAGYGTAEVEITATDAGGDSAAPVTGSFVVWKAVTTTGKTKLTSTKDLTQYNYFIISNKNSQKYLAVEDGNLTTISSDTAETAKWQINNTTIQNIKTKEYLKIAKNSASLDTNISSISLSNQSSDWRIKAYGNNYYLTLSNSAVTSSSKSNYDWIIEGVKENTTYVDPTK